MDIQKPDVRSIVEDIEKGKIALPDFQRDFVWKSDDVQDLLVSVLADYYIGTMLVIDDVKDEAGFKLRLVPGVPATTTISSIVKILLDGQQRCSSLYYALRAPDIPLSGRKNPSRFYLNVSSAMADDWQSTVETVHLNSKSALTKIDADPNYIAFPLLLNAAALVVKLQERGQTDQIGGVVSFTNKLASYQVQMVQLKRETPLERVVEVFERINRTGMPLNITDLLVARMMRAKVQLRELIEIAREAYSVFGDESQVDIEFALRLMCLMRQITVSKKSILNLDPINFDKDWSLCCGYLQKAHDRITNPMGGYGSVDFRRMVPFKTMIVPLAALLWKIESNKSLHSDASFLKLDQWYWASVFGNRYNEAVNTTTPADFEKMVAWLHDDEKLPEFISRFNVDTIDFRVTSKASSTYRGVLNLVVLAGAKDFKTGADPLANKTILEDDHIFPKSIYKDNEITNRTLIGSNAEKSNKQPSQYFGALETLSGHDRLMEILESHLLDANCYQAMLQNDIEKFKKAREGFLRSEIRKKVPAAAGFGS